MRRLQKVLMGIPTLGLIAVLTMGSNESACAPEQNSNDVQRDQQERLLSEGTRQTGMPAIVNFRERKILKTILEHRDQEDYTTYTYQYVNMTGRLVPFCHSIGYPIPYSTQYTAPTAVQRYNLTDPSGHWAYGVEALPQADPNGLFSPASADGTWVMCKDPSSGKLGAVYSEPRVISSPFPVTTDKFPGDK